MPEDSEPQHKAKIITAEDIFEPQLLAKYDPTIVEYIVKRAQEGVTEQHQIPIAEVRANPEKFRQPWALDTTGLERVVDRELISEDGAKIPVKVYYPDPAVWGDGPYGAHLNFHGGGFVFGDLTTESSLCLSMRDGAGVVVIDVNYRHCPEAIWGKCIEDAWAALLWVRDPTSKLNVKPESISIGGVSAGGQIVAVLQHKARDGEVPLVLCMPTVPVTGEWLDYKQYTDSPHRSFHEFHRGPVLPWTRIEYFIKHCVSKCEAEKLRETWPDWWIAPLKAKNWKGLCDTFIRTAEVDPLRDEGEEYGMKLVAGGNKVTMKRYPASPHLFAFYDWLAQKRDFDRDSIKALRHAHGTRRVV